jgi:hypothetical protein
MKLRGSLSFTSVGAANARADKSSGLALLVFKRHIPIKVITLTTAATHLVLWLFGNFKFLAINHTSAAVNSRRKETHVIRPAISLSVARIP